MKTPLFFAALSLPAPVADLDRLVATAQEPSMIELFEEYVVVLAPLLILAVVGIVAYAIFAASREETIQGAAKTECKGEIMVAMRKHIAGLTVHEIAQTLKITEGQALFVLEEMKADNQVYEAEHRGRKVYRLRGIGEGGV